MRAGTACACRRRRCSSARPPGRRDRDPGHALACGSRSERRDLRAEIPADFWAELKHEGLLRADAPTPRGLLGRAAVRPASAAAQPDQRCRRLGGRPPAVLVGGQARYSGRRHRPEIEGAGAVRSDHPYNSAAPSAAPWRLPDTATGCPGRRAASSSANSRWSANAPSMITWTTRAQEIQARAGHQRQV